MTRFALPAALVLFCAACSQERETPAEETAAQAEPAAAEPVPPPSPQEEPATAYRYTSLGGCELLRENREEGGFVETMCPGLGGYRLRFSESDLRHNLAVIAPGGTETDLALGRIGGGGFSTLGERVEWRGPAGEPFEPDAFVVRFQVAEEPYPAPETSYLLAVRLTPTPCVVGRIAPGPGQNEAARAAADQPGPCIE